MTKIKICGLRRECDVGYVNEACPEYVGFVFANTRRRITVEDARRLKRNLRKEIQAVGVFVEEEREKVAWMLQEGIIDIAQLHGGEPAEYAEWLKRNTGCPVIKALHPEEIGRSMPYNVKSCTQIQIQNQGRDFYREYIEAGVDYFLFDSGSRTQAGGTGKVFDWSLIPEGGHPFFLAGGLNAGNVEEAVRAVSPYAVDISSGVETDGCKDREKILEIVRRIRNV